MPSSSVSAGLPLAVASSSQYRLIDTALAHFNLRKHFALVHSAQTRSMASRIRLSSLVAAKKLGVDPRRCLVWEDAPAGVLAAKAASMGCIAVPSWGGPSSGVRVGRPGADLAG